MGVNVSCWRVTVCINCCVPLLKRKPPGVILNWEVTSMPQTVLKTPLGPEAYRTEELTGSIASPETERSLSPRLIGNQWSPPSRLLKTPPPPKLPTYKVS